MAPLVSDRERLGHLLFYGAVILIGYLLMFLVAVWAIVRIVMGLQKASSEEPMPNPQSWRGRTFERS